MNIFKKRIKYMKKCDHKNICRFNEKIENNYKNVCEVLKF